MIKCVYCQNQETDSESHIIPEGLGTGPTLLGAVGRSCNNDFGKVEQVIIKALAPITNFLQLTGKRGKRPALELEADFGDVKQRIKVRNPQDLKQRLFSYKTAISSDGKKKKIAFIGPIDQLEEARKSYSEKYPNTTWEDMQSSDISDVAFYLHFDFAIFYNPFCMRAVAKIAFEWWIKQRSPGVVQGNEYDAIRNFIKAGEFPNYPIVSIVQDRTIINAFGPIPFGIHTLFCSIDPHSSNLVILVGLFSLVFYKVILTKRHTALAKIEQLATVNPQTGQYYEPIIRLSLRSGPYISKIEKADCIDPLKAIQNMKPFLLNRLNNGFEAIRAQST
ncbi:MAG: hypothetical protein HY538_07770 [Deltaproteobacteria bacterium]|nr:hypothetical protein [Deltaproteobacteria bacterium]